MKIELGCLTISSRHRSPARITNEEGGRKGIASAFHPIFRSPRLRGPRKFIRLWNLSNFICEFSSDITESNDTNFSQNIYNYVFKVYNEQQRIFHVPQAFFFLYSQLQERWRYSGRINTDFYSNRNLYTLYIRGVCVYLISNMIILEL